MYEDTNVFSWPWPLINDLLSWIWRRNKSQLLQRRQRAFLPDLLDNLSTPQREYRRPREVHFLAGVRGIEFTH